MYLADLHIHSRFSRATSKDCDTPHLDWWARRKGIQLLGTGDFTHPAWRAELKEQLVPVGEGVYVLREDLRLPCDIPGSSPHFVVTGEISSIYKRDGKTRKVHNVILLPSLEAADELSAKLEAIGNIRADGRPILGLDSRDLLELTLETCPDAEFIPAHIWTPHFSLFGAFSGFDTIEACFGDLTSHIHAVETGLSSDPPMNWRLSALDNLTLVSHSDAHSPAKLGREANLLDTGLSYPELIQAIRTGEGFLGTIEFFPEEGKYHLDGHRRCGICLTPSETAEYGGLCPVCGKKLTIGVEHRVEQLADRPAGFRPPNAKPFESLAPLPEVIAASTGYSLASKKTTDRYETMLRTLGAEFSILREIPIAEIKQIAGPCIAEGIRRLRAGQVERKAGFDGEYGTIGLLAPAEIEQLSGQISLFGTGAPKEPKKPQQEKKILPVLPQSPHRFHPEETLNPKQQEAVCAPLGTLAVVAGPGTGKTKTLAARIAYLLKEQGVKPDEITAVTFTNQAAAEMRRRLEIPLGKRVVNRMTIGTFHGLCLGLLKNVRLISPGEALAIALEILGSHKKKMEGKSFLQAVSRVKNGASFPSAGIEESLYTAYCSRLQELGVLDFDDLLTEALRIDIRGHRAFSHLLVDEFQDINDTQYDLIRTWSREGNSLFVIGDPDQSIYGFRGASSRCFQRLAEDFPGMQEIRLTENYRSTAEILQAAGSVINKNPGGPRLLSPHRHSGAAVRLIQAETPFSEAVFLAKEIARMTGGVDMLETQALDPDRTPFAFSDIAVICRTHRQLDRIEIALQREDIPCIVIGREDFWDTPQVRGVLSFFRSLQVPEDRIALETALRLLWDCPADLIQKAQQACQDLKTFDLPRLREAAQGYGHLEAWLARGQEWMDWVEKEKPWKLVKRWEDTYGSSPALERLRNTAVFYSSFQELWNTCILGQEADFQRAAGKGWKSGAVRLMTFHAAKGLEFPVVFAAGIQAGILPLESQTNPADIEEERRLLYVGMTRAQEELILSASPVPSPFLEDLPDNIVKETTGKPQELPAEQIRFF